MTVSHDAIPGFMDAMTMPFEVNNAKALAGLTPGTVVAFTLTSAVQPSVADAIRVVHYENIEQDPFNASRLKLLSDLARRRGASVRQWHRWRWARPCPTSR